MKREVKFRVVLKNKSIIYFSNPSLLPKICNNYSLNFSSDFIEKNYKNIDQDIIIQQFTGLLDKQGTEIYEGDSVESGNVYLPEKGKIIFEKCSFLFDGNEYGYSKHYLEDFILFDNWADLIIIK